MVLFTGSGAQIEGASGNPCGWKAPYINASSLMVSFVQACVLENFVYFVNDSPFTKVEQTFLTWRRNADKQRDHRRRRKLDQPCLRHFARRLSVRIWSDVRRSFGHDHDGQQNWTH